MEIEIADATALPEHLRPLVADGKLNLAQLAPSSEVEKFKGKALTAQQEAIERRKENEAWKRLGASPDEISAKLAAGADPKIIDQMRAQMAETEAGYKGKLAKVLGERATADLKAELAKAGVVPEGLDILAGYAAPRVRFDDDGNLRIMGPDGQSPMIGQGANGGATLADLAASLAKGMPYLVADKGAGGGGKPSNSNGGKPGATTITRAAYNALSPAEQRTIALAGTTFTD